jgi:hypothetical protein
MRTLSRKTVIYGIALLVLLVGGTCLLILNFQNGYQLDVGVGGVTRTNAGISENSISPSGIAGVSVEGTVEKSKSGKQQAILDETRNSTVQMSLAAGESSPYQGVAYDNALPNMSEKVIRKANLQIQIKKKKFEEAYEKATAIVSEKRGYISSSRTSATGGRITGGELVIRVPASRFDDLMKSLKGLGKIQGMEVSSEEVSQEYVDLKSRLRNWRAQEAVMLDLMRRAKTISDSVTIQNNLQEIQMEIEQISGRLQYLDDRVGYSEINLSLNEPQVVPVKGSPGIKTALKNALEASIAVISTMIVLIGYLLPLLIVGALIFVANKQIRKRATAKIMNGKTA